MFVVEIIKSCLKQKVLQLFLVQIFCFKSVYDMLVQNYMFGTE